MSISVLEPRMKDIEIMKQDPYYSNLRLSTMRDISIMPGGGGGQDEYLKYEANFINSQQLDKGAFKVPDYNVFIQKRENIRKNTNNYLTLTEAKLPRPVVVSDINIIKQQPQINLVNVNIPMLSDLKDDEQEEVLGENRINESIRSQSALIEKFKTIQMQNPVTLPGTSSVSRQDLMKLIER